MKQITYRVRGLVRGHWYGVSSILFALTVSAGLLAPEQPQASNVAQVSADAFIAPVDVKRLARDYGVQSEMARRRPTQAAYEDELYCLAQNIYFESRSESTAGKRAVAHVVLNRVASDRFPDTICGVVKQGGERKRHRCQFSWWCDGRKDEIKNAEAWEEAEKLAAYVYWGVSSDLTEGALWYHADYVNPKWRNAFEEGPTIGRHIFYREPSEDTLKVAQLDVK